MIIRLSLITVFLWGMDVEAQISITSSADPQPKPVAPYDSMRNFLGTDYLQYEGQEFYVIPLPESLRQYGFEGFILECRKTSPPDDSNVFACCSSFNSKYEALAGKYFKVLEVVRSTDMGMPCLKLECKDSKEVVYFKYDVYSEMTFPFLVVGYFEKQRTLFQDHEVLIRPFPVLEGLNQKKTLNIETGEAISIVRGS
jgi:hypothetical protein